MRRQIAALKAEIEQPRLMTKTKAKSEPTYLLDCVLPPTDVIADGFLAKLSSIFHYANRVQVTLRSRLLRRRANKSETIACQNGLPAA